MIEPLHYLKFMKQENNKHNHIFKFQPIIDGLNSATNQELSLFNAGKGYEEFNTFIFHAGHKSDAEEYAETGKGSTHIIWNQLSDNEREMVAYFTLSANVIPYDDGIEDDRAVLSNYPSIPVLEIKMFSVDDKYQDLFFDDGIEDMPISAWCIKAIVSYANDLSTNIVGFQALYLHAVPTAVSFYETNGFSTLPKEARPLFSIDQECTAMWLSIRSVLLRDD